MTAEERVASLHVRMRALRRRRELRKTAALGIACGCVTACLLMLVFVEGSVCRGSIINGTAGLYSGATMLFENAGGYVLAAVLAFMAGTVISVICIRRRDKGKKK